MYEPSRPPIEEISALNIPARPRRNRQVQMFVLDGTLQHLVSSLSCLPGFLLSGIQGADCSGQQQCYSQDATLVILGRQKYGSISCCSCLLQCSRLLCAGWNRRVAWLLAPDVQPALMQTLSSFVGDCPNTEVLHDVLDLMCSLL